MKSMQQENPPRGKKNGGAYSISAKFCSTYQCGAFSNDDILILAAYKKSKKACRETYSNSTNPKLSHIDIKK